MRFYNLFLLFIFLNFSCTTNSVNDDFSNEISLNEAKTNGLHIVIEEAGFKKIVDLRNKYVHKKIFNEKLYSKALLISGNDTVSAILRLKGDHTDHLQGNRWSYRIKTDGKVLKESKFSIQGLKTRSYFSERLFHEFLKNEGLVHLQYEFIPVTINEIDSFAGVYAYESHFKSDILVNQNLKLGPILKFNEDEFWDYKNKAEKGQDRDSLLRTISKIELTNRKGFDKETGKKSIKMLQDFIQNKVAAEKVFDMLKWARFLTVNAFMGCNHAMRWHNLRFYLNPETNLLEPVGFDLSTWFLKNGAWHLNKDSVESFYKPFYESSVFLNELLETTKRISEKSYLDDFFENRKYVFNDCIDLIREEKTNYKLNKKVLYRIQEIFKNDLKSF